MDISMPEMDGLEATRQIQANWPVERRPRIVALTANVLAADQAVFRGAGMEDFLSKPFAVEELKTEAKAGNFVRMERQQMATVQALVEQVIHELKSEVA